ncbi:MAG: thrombospondin type 3 repeat-containing protein [Deltaproteobacteria bacterium]|nr:thrombospondin type 3 repeat-containing protein [Deltaproteobacteria bacterium]
MKQVFKTLGLYILSASVLVMGVRCSPSGEPEAQKQSRSVAQTSGGNRLPVLQFQPNGEPPNALKRGDTAVINGSASSDPEGKLLTFTWILIDKPSAAAADPLDPHSGHTVSFVTSSSTELGAYKYKLQLRDDANMVQFPFAITVVDAVVGGLPDADGDGIPDLHDKYPTCDDRKDRDFDGIPDACDSSPDDKGTDSDGDGIPTENVGLGPDNCSSVKNPLQKDHDQDGIGDACDDCTSIKLSEYAILATYSYYGCTGSAAWGTSLETKSVDIRLKVLGAQLGTGLQSSVTTKTEVCPGLSHPQIGDKGGTISFDLSWLTLGQAVTLFSDSSLGQQAQTITGGAAFTAAIALESPKTVKPNWSISNGGSVTIPQCWNEDGP